MRSHLLFSNLDLRQNVDIVDLVAQPHVQFWLKGQGEVKVAVEVEVGRLRDFMSALHSVTQPLLRWDVEWIPSKFDLPIHGVACLLVVVGRLPSSIYQHVGVRWKSI